MKKYLFIGIAATAMLASCTNDEIVEVAPQKAIGFESFINKSTRAAADVTTANLKAFELYGWRGETAIFNKQEVTADNGTCTYSPLQYWAGGNNYVFEAVAPKNGEKGVTFTPALNSSSITFESNSETDLIYATQEKDLTNTTNVTTDPGKVALTFNHLLSRVKFSFKNGFAADAKVKITVTDVAITNAGSTGTYATSTSTWAAATKESNVAFASTNVANVEPTKDAETEHKYLIPYNVANYNLTFTVTMTQGSVSDKYTHNVTLPNLTLKAGLSYDFTAELKADNINPAGTMFPIVFSASVTEWAGYTENPVTVPAAKETEKAE